MGRDQDHLIALADETAGVALSNAEDLTEPLYDFKTDIEGPGGAELVGILDTGDYFTGTNVEDALQELGAASGASFVVDSIVNGDTTHAPSGNAVYDALGFKQNLDASLTSLSDNDWVPNAIPVGVAPLAVSQVVLGTNTFLARSSITNVEAKTITDFALSLVDDPDAATARTTLGAQASDATLTALAGNDWVNNSIPVGNGANTMTQLPVAANQFVARNSSGGLNAHTVTDYALTLLDDANAAAARTTLEIISGTYTPTFVGVANVTGTPTTADSWLYTRIGDIVEVTGSALVNVTAISTLTQFRISLPIASNLQSATNDDLIGIGTSGSGVSQPAVFLRSDTTNDAAFAQFGSAGTGSTPVRVQFTYRIRV